MGIAGALWGWPPREFWRATPHEFWACWELHQEANTPRKER